MSNFLGAALGATFPGLLSTAASFALPMVGDYMQYQGQKDTNVSNAKIAADQMAFQERMAGSAHQREVNDLRSAGLNPILSGTGGAGAATPPGATTRMENPAEGLGDKMRASILQNAQVTNLKEQTKNIVEDTELKNRQGKLSSQQWNESQAKTGLYQQQELTEQQNTRAAEHTAAILSSNAKGAHLEGQIDESHYGAVMRYIDRAIKAITGSSQSVRNINMTPPVR